MRKKEKQQIMEIINLLSRIHEAVERRAAQGKIAGVWDTLAECQQAASAAGERIERSEGGGHPAIPLLEEYCETVFEAVGELEKGVYFADGTGKRLQRQLAGIRSCVQNELPVREEVVFFPYKASMWDALESVYLAAEADPGCDAYCVPIPYYELHPDRSFGAMHCEKGEYPAWVRVMDWRDYDIEERRPDKVYIHNAYDDCNLVTSVHPDYYSGRLKRYTDQLIYIPYFVLGETDPDDRAAVEGMKHFVWLPGVVNADKVILQSENMKRIYIEEYLKEAKKNGFGRCHCDRDFLEKKFCAEGSPKLERVQRLKKEDFDVPVEWKRIIERADGTPKKIIFYNTSISALLHYDEKMLEKIGRVLELFREKQESAALWWRPHPLLQSTIRAMCPHLWERYRTLVQQYRKEGWGIYDDSADVDRAVVLCDAYYGDPSSVVELCRKRRMPVMIQDPEL